MNPKDAVPPVGSATSPVNLRTRADGVQPLDAEKLRSLYAQMLRCRLASQRIRTVLRMSEAELPFAESLHVGLLTDLSERDFVASPSFVLPSELMKRVPLSSIVAELRHEKAARKQSSGYCSQNGLNVGVIPPAEIATVQVAVATGIAVRMNYEKSGDVVVVFTSETARSTASWREALDFAKNHRLPVIFVVTGEPSKPKGKRSFRSNGANPAYPAIPVAANDVVAIYRVAQEAIHRARNGGGPTLVCASCETAPGQPLEDPLLYMQGYLHKRGMWSAAWKRDLVSAMKRELAGALTRTPRR